MSDPLLPQDDGNTLLNDEEREGLELSYVTTRGDLNAAEQQNILKAQTWAQKRKNNVLTRNFLNDLHKRMYGDVWSWARSPLPGGVRLCVAREKPGRPILPRYVRPMGTTSRLCWNSCGVELSGKLEIPSRHASNLHQT